MGVCTAIQKPNAKPKKIEINQTSLIKTINESKQTTSTPSNKFIRKHEHHHTANAKISQKTTKPKPKSSSKHFKDDQPSKTQLTSNDTDSKYHPFLTVINPVTPTQTKSSKFQRKGHRSISLIEKNKLGSQIFKEELKLKVTINTLVEETSGLPTSKYKVISKLGEGSYGTVYLAINIMTKAKVSMKKINKVKDNEINELEIKNEIDILKKLDHPNVLKILEFYSTHKAYYIITGYCSKGELYSQITYKFSEHQLAVLFYQVFSGLLYLHSNHIVHRDLKLENILISDIENDILTDNKYFWVKIIDFGTAKIFEKNKSEKVVVGSSYYIAPEVLNKKYNEKCDTWSVGVILYMFLVGRAPFDGDNDDEIIQNIKNGCFNSEHHKLQSASNEVQDLVKQLLEVNVANRLSAAEALKHPWFVKFDSKRLYKNIEVNKVEMYIDRLMHYQINSKFQQMVLAFIVHNVPDSEETKDILKIFRQFNENDDGKLTKNELFNGLAKYVKTNKLKQYINDLFLILDGAGRGYIEYEEFLRACIDKHNVLSDEHLVYAFNFFDKNNTGRINVEAIKANFIDSTVSEDVFKNIFNEIDINQDGEIDFAEFKAMMLGHTA